MAARYEAVGTVVVRLLMRPKAVHTAAIHMLKVYEPKGTMLSVADKQIALWSMMVCLEGQL